MHMNDDVTIIYQVFEIIIDGITIFSAFLVRDTMIKVMDTILPDRGTNIFSNLLYTFFIVLISVLFICIIRKCILYPKQKQISHLNQNSTRQKRDPVTYNLFD